MPMYSFTHNGQRFRLDSGDIESNFVGQSPEAIQKHWVEVLGARWPVNQAMRIAIGAQQPPVRSSAARRHFRGAGYLEGTDGKSAVSSARPRSKAALVDVTDMPSRTRSQNRFSRSFMTTLDAINNTSLIRCCYDPLKPPLSFRDIWWAIGGAHGSKYSQWRSTAITGGAQGVKVLRPTQHRANSAVRKQDRSVCFYYAYRARSSV